MSDDNKIQNAAKRFMQEDDGAVTVDWIVLTAAVVGLAAGGSGTIGDAISVLSGKISDGVENTEVDNGDS